MTTVQSVYCNIYAFSCYCSCCAVSIWIMISIDIPTIWIEYYFNSCFFSFFNFNSIYWLLLLQTHWFSHAWGHSLIFMSKFSNFIERYHSIWFPTQMLLFMCQLCKISSCSATDPPSCIAANLTSSISYVFYSKSSSILNIFFGVKYSQITQQCRCVNKIRL